MFIFLSFYIFCCLCFNFSTFSVFFDDFLFSGSKLIGYVEEK